MRTGGLFQFYAIRMQFALNNSILVGIMRKFMLT